MKNIFSIQTFIHLLYKLDSECKKERKKKYLHTYTTAQIYTHFPAVLCRQRINLLALSLSFTLSSFELVVNESSLHLGFLSLEFRLCEEKQHSDHTHTQKKTVMRKHPFMTL